MDKYTQHFILQALLVSIIPMGIFMIGYYLKLDFGLTLLISVVILVPSWLWNMLKMGYYYNLDIDLSVKQEMCADLKRLGIKNGSES